VTVERPVVAAFDVDRTLTTRDCVVPFMCCVGGTLPFAARVGLAAPRLLPAAARRDRDGLKAQASRLAFAGRRAVDVERAGEQFAAAVERSRLRPDTRARLHWHREAGHDVVFVSASFAVYLLPLARRLGVGTVLGTELVVGADGRLTGALVGANCRGAEKVRRLHTWLEERYGGRDRVVLWAYGDSAGDRELLADADHPVWAGAALPAVPELVT
jgi:phosphatidylglycerophosphatase C